MRKTYLLSYVFLTLSVFFSTAGFSQPGKNKKGGVVQFDSTFHDFGNINESLVVVRHRFMFKNTGDSAVKITKVQPSCGCTVAEYTKESVPPNGKGFVELAFDLVNRQGKNEKSTTVYTSGTPNVLLLTFSATVIERPRNWQDTFSHNSGSLYFESATIPFGNLTTRQSDTTNYVRIYNPGAKAITFNEFKSAVPYVSAVKMPFTVQPGERAKFYVRYDASKVTDYGLVYSTFRIMTTDEKVPEKSVGVYADVKPYVGQATATSPQLFAPKLSHDFGVVRQGDDVKTEFTITNKGKEELKIFKIKSSCGCTVGSADKLSLKPGESTQIKVTYSSKGMMGDESRNVTIYSNDPVRPEQTLTIKAQVKSADDVDAQQKGGKKH